MDFTTDLAPSAPIVIDASTTPTLKPTPLVETIPLSGLDLMDHYIPPPATPPPTPDTCSPSPLRYPETLPYLITIQPTSPPSKGLGIFAACDIPPGTVLLSEAPLLVLTDTGSRHDPLDVSVAALSPSQRASFLSLSAYSSNKHESRNRSIVYSNGYSIIDEFTTGIFETASRINHSCVPNSQYVWKAAIGRIVFWNRFKLLEGEEVTVDYGHRKHWLKKIYGFECTCGGCTDPGSSDAKSSSGSEGGSTEEMGSINEILKKNVAVGEEA